jgi:hypothetical protein
MEKILLIINRKEGNIAGHLQFRIPDDALSGQFRDNLQEYFYVTQYFQSKFRSKGKYLLVRDLIGTDRHEDVNYGFSNASIKTFSEKKFPFLQ